MQVSVELDEAKLAAVQHMLHAIKGGLPKALSGAVNDTVRKEKTQVSKLIRARVNIKKKDIDRFIGSTRATPARPSAHLTLSESERLPLKYFGARQTKAGVTYKIDKAGSRKRIRDAFGPKIARLGGHVFRRLLGQRGRFPITKLHGPSPWGVFLKAGLDKPLEADASTELEKQLDRRVQFMLLKAEGVI